MVLSPVNYSVGLGAIDPAYGGLAEYRNFQVRPYAPSGTWTSAPLDLGGTPLKPGRVDWSASIPSGTGLQIQCASSPDNATWSAFSASLPSGSTFSAPLARYVKFQASLQADAAGANSPSLSSITLTQDDLSGELLQAANVKITPNPARGDKVLLRYGLTQAAQKVSIEVYSPSGRLLWTDNNGSTQIGQDQWMLNASSLASGSYLVRVLAWAQAGGQPQIVTKAFALLR